MTFRRVRRNVVLHGAVLLEGWHLPRRSVRPADVISVLSEWVLRRARFTGRRGGAAPRH